LPSGDYRLDKSHAYILWKISHLGLSSYIARFTDFDIDLVLDSKDLSRSSVEAIVNAQSISTENLSFDKQLQGSSWFNAEQFPTIRFVSTAYKHIGENKGELIGLLELLGISHEVKFDVIVNGIIESHPFKFNTVAVGFSASSEIDRTKWGLDKFMGSVGKSVTIEISGEFFRLK